MKKSSLLFILLISILSLSAQNKLDNLGLSSVSPQVAYSLRKLSSSYTGPAIKVRRSSDYAEANVYFDASLTPPAVSANSTVTFTPGVTVTTTLGTTANGTISTVSTQSGTITVVVNKTGTITTTGGSTTLTGTGTLFTTELAVGDILYRSSDNALIGIVKSITNNTQAILNNGAITSYIGSAYKTASALVTGSSGLEFSELFSVGDRVYNSSNVYLGRVTAIKSNISMTLNSLDAVATSATSFRYTTATVTGSGTNFTSEDIGKLLISNNITLGIIASVASTTSLTLTAKAGAAVTAQAYKMYTVPANFGSFYASVDVLVNTWYDQSGLGRDAIQTVATNQPKLVSVGNLLTMNGKPSLQFSPSLTSYLRTTSAASWLANTLYTLNSVTAEASATISSSAYSFMMSTTGYGPNNTLMHSGYRTSNQYTVAQYGNDQNFYTQATTQLEIHTSVKNAVGSSQFYKNTASLGTLTSSAASNIIDPGLFNIGIYTAVTNAWFNGSIAEIVIFNSALNSTNRSNMDNNQAAYYGISTANWTGGAGTTDWNTPSNWSPAVVPDASSPSMVVIPAGRTYYPNITATSAGNNVVVETGGSLTISSGGKLQLGGAITLSGTFTATSGTIELIGASAQSFSLSNPIQNIIINNPSGVSLNGNLNVSGNLTFTAGYLSIGGMTLTLGGTVTNTVAGGLYGSSNSSIIVTGSPSLSFNQSSTNNMLKNLTINGSSAVATMVNNLVMVGSGALTFTNGKLAIGSNTLSIAGAVTNTVAGGLRGSSSSNITVNGLLSPTLSFDQTTPGTTNLLNNFTIATTSTNTVSIGNNLLVNGILTVNADQSLNLGTASLGGTLATVANNGTITTQNTSSTPLTSGKTWGGTVNYNSVSTLQTAVSGTYNNLTISTTGGATASGDITVNGTLNLSATNPSATRGTLEMTKSYANYPGITNTSYLDSYILYMGATAVTSGGQGDVTGTIKRNTILANTSYTFGSPYSTIMLTTGIMPAALSVTVTIGNSPPGGLLTDIYMKDCFRRTYEIVPTVPDGYISTSHVMANFHYLDTELTSSVSGYINTEANTTTWDYDIGGGTIADEHGRANYDFTNNYIGLSNVPIDYFINIPGHDWRTVFSLRDYVVSHKTWNGSINTSWDEANNWTPGGIPGEGTMVIIPDAATTTFHPVLNNDVIINTMAIENGGIINLGANTITIKTTLSGGWEDQNPNGNDPGTSKVIFLNSGSTVSGHARFYNVEIADEGDLTNQQGSSMKIENLLTRVGTGKWYPAVYNNTIEYSNSGDQTILIPDGTGAYSSLALSGSGTKTFPTSALSINGNLTTSGTITTTPAHSLTIGGNLSIGSGTTFISGSLTHYLGGNFSNSGTFTSAGSTISMNGSSAQSISNTVPTSFANLTIDNAAGVTLSSPNITTVTDTLAINSGKVFNVAAGKQLTVSGTISNSAGSEGLVLKSSETGTASLLHSDAGVAATVERYCPNDWQWHFLSSPVSNQPIWPQFASTPTGDPLSFGSGPFNWDFYYWNPNASTSSQLYWVNLRMNSAGDYNDRIVDETGSDGGFGMAVPKFTVGRGYLTAYTSDWADGSPTVHRFTGDLNEGSVSTSMIAGANTFNLAGNPYPSAIDWKASGGWTRNSLLANGSGYDYWIWNDTDGNYGVFNSSGSDGSGTNSTSRYIASGQAFFVQASADGSLAMNDNVRTHSSQEWLKSAETQGEFVRLRLTSNANTFNDEMVVDFNPEYAGGGSPKFWSFYGDSPEIYSVKDGKNYSIDRYSGLNEDLTVNIAAKTGVDASYVLTASNLDAFSLTDLVYLIDLKTNTKINLKQTPSYTFTGLPGDDRNRFQLVFGTTTAVNQKTTSVFSIYANENSIYIRNDDNSDPYTITVSNILGQIVKRTQVAGNSLNRIEVNRIPGVYLVSVISKGQSFSKKVVIK